MRSGCGQHKITSVCGMTILEITMVIVIIMVSSAIVLPSLVNFIGYNDIDIEAKKLQAKIREIQQMAINDEEYTDYQAIFDLEDEELAVYRYKRTFPQATTFVETIGFDSGIDVVATTFNSGGAGENALVFGDLGVPEEAGYIEITDSKGKCRHITIAETSGTVSIVEVIEE